MLLLGALAGASAHARPPTPTTPPTTTSATLAETEPRQALPTRDPSSYACFPSDLTNAELNQALERYNLLPPPLALSPDRFFTDTKVWTADGLIGDRDRAQPAHLTYSFPSDGVTWGMAPLFTTGPNDLNLRFSQLFGPANIDHGRELIRQALAGWRRVAGLTYDETADDDAPFSTSSTRSASRGDIRFGALAYPADSFLAYNAFPSTTGSTGTGGGDMTLNSINFTPDRFNNPANNFRYLRNTIAHEHGHGLGAIHTTPCNNSKLMEPFLNLNFDMQAPDELRGAARNYGDRFAGNQTSGLTFNLGNLTTPTLRSVILRNLSTNGFTGALNTKEDWFRFTISSTQTITITVAPTGGLYPNGQQTSACDPTSPPIINASQAGNLNIALLESTGTTVLASAASQGPGTAEVLSAGPRPAASYLVRITDVGPSANQDVQLYDLTIRVGSALAPPDPIAGLNKRIRAGDNCFFMGDINSSPTEAATTILAYDWDLDSDGLFETLNTPQPILKYPSTGLFNATLRITDSNGLIATDTITVQVFGTGAPLAISPTSANTGTILPVTLTGSNLFGVSSAAQVSVAGGGVTVTGTPALSPLGDQITGLSFNIAAGAFPGPRNVTVQTSAGPNTGVSAFSVTSPGPTPPAAFTLLNPPDNASESSLTPTFQWTTSANAFTYEFTLFRDTNDDGFFEDTLFTETGILGLSRPTSFPGLRSRTSYAWSVAARNTAGATPSSPPTAVFRTISCLGDANYDRVVDFADITAVLANWAAQYTPDHSGPGDANNDAVVNFADITAVLSRWAIICP